MDSLKESLAKWCEKYMAGVWTLALTTVLTVGCADIQKARNTLDNADKAAREWAEIGEDVKAITGPVRSVVEVFTRGTDEASREAGIILNEHGVTVEQAVQIIGAIRDERQQRLDSGTAVLTGERLAERRQDRIDRRNDRLDKTR